jgi:hypothetical protein
VKLTPIVVIASNKHESRAVADICRICFRGFGHLDYRREQAQPVLGRLPGDIVWRGKNTTFYFPWVTCLLLSLLATLILWLINRRP